jgi:hypothetical protein
MRLGFAAIMFVALGMGLALADDNGGELFQNFAKTCGTKPLSGAELDTRARRLGYLRQNGSNDPDDGKRDLDFLYFWRLPDKRTDFAIDAYFFGPRAHYQVNCAIRSGNVDFDAFVEGLERNTSLPAPQVTSDPKTNAPIYTWTVDAEGANDILVVEAFGEDHRRVDVRLTYEVIAR